MLTRSFGRLFIVVMLGAALLVPSSGSAMQASPESAMENPFADLGLQQIDITMTDTAFEGVPSELDAGRYIIAFTNTIESPFTQGGAFLQIPQGMTADDFINMEGSEESTPVPDGMATAEASPMSDDEESGAPAWYYDAVRVGGPYALTGQTVYAVVELTAGEWIFWAEYTSAPQSAVPITVTGEIPADAPVPAADITIEMSEFAFTFSSEPTAGTQVIELINVGEQPHFMGVGQLPDGTTSDDVMGLLESEFGMAMGTPVATPDDALSFEDVVEVFSTGDQSAGTTAWYVLTLEPGTFSAVCFIPDAETELPHAMLGMVEVFDIAD